MKKNTRQDYKELDLTLNHISSCLPNDVNYNPRTFKRNNRKIGVYLNSDINTDIKICKSKKGNYYVNVPRDSTLLYDYIKESVCKGLGIKPKSKK